MLILLEGPDGGGKSTLYKKLQDILPKSFKFIEHIDRRLTGQYEWYNHIIESQDKYVVDRGFISELVYRTILDDDSMNIELSDFVDLLNSNLSIIYCCSESSYNDCYKRGETFIDYCQWPQVKDFYDTLMKIIDRFTLASVYHYDWRNTDINLLIKAFVR